MNASETGLSALPYPGLRPFQRGEADIFFGRDQQVDQLLTKLEQGRFLAVVGPSGAGKSSLVRAGLLSGLEGGFLAAAGVAWRVAEMRPGSHPLGALADALLRSDVLGEQWSSHPHAAEFLVAMLQRGPLSLIELLRETQLPRCANLLLLVDQFEEIFRFREHGDSDDAIAFVNLLLNAAAHPQSRAYVVLTMRSDFLGDCAVFPGLPEALNDSQFLTPRLTREQCRAAIAGPAAVFGARVQPALVNRILNDMGTDPDQLPLMQHTLMRMWTIATRNGTAAPPAENGGESQAPPEVTPLEIELTLAHYDAVGGLAKGLSQHADEIFASLEPSDRPIAEILFRGLGERGEGQRDTRRPLPLTSIADVAGVSPHRVARVVEVFRQPDCCFLMPPAGVPLHEDTVLDISHESLIRQWDQMAKWLEREHQSATMYRRLAETAKLWTRGQAGLWGSPDLDNALQWREREKPNPAWARRYGEGFELSMEFLNASLAERDRRRREEQEREAHIRRMHRLRVYSIAGSILLLVVSGLAGTALYQWRRADDAAEDAKYQWRRAEDARADAVAQEAKAKRQARIATAQRLAVEANAVRDKQPQLSVLLAVEALRATEEDGKQTLRVAAAEQALRDALAVDRGYRLRGHQSPIHTLAISPDERWLVTGSAEGVARLWNLRAEDPSRESRLLPMVRDVLRLPGWGSASPPPTFRFAAQQAAPIGKGPVVPSGVTAVAISPDSRWLVTAGADGAAWLWNLGDDDPSRTPIRLPSRVSPQISRFEPANHDGSQGGREDFVATTIPLGQAPQRENALAISPDSRWLATTYPDGSARLWDLQADDPSRDWHELAGHADAIRTVVFSPDQRWLITAGTDRTVRRWDLTQDFSDPISLELLDHDDPIHALAVSPDSRWVAAAGELAVTLWNLKSPDPSRRADVLKSITRPDVIAISPDGQWLVTAQNRPTRARNTPVLLWDLTGEKPSEKRWELEWEGWGPLFNALAISSDSRWLVAAGADSSLAALWDLTAIRQSPVSSTTAAERGYVHRLVDDDNPRRARILTGHEDALRAVAVGLIRERHWALTGSGDTTVRLWDLGSDSPSSQSIVLRGHDGPVSTLVVSSSNKWLVTGSVDNTARIWDLTAPGLFAPSFVLRGHDSPVSQVSYSGDGRWLNTASRDGTVRRWDAGSSPPLGEPLRVDGPVRAVAFSPDGQTVLTASDDSRARLWDVASGQPRGEPLEHADAVTAVAFSPDGRIVLTGSVDGMARLWDAASGQLRGATRPHESPVTAVAFSPDGRTLITGSLDGTAHLWDAPSGQLRGETLPHDSPVTAVAFSPDGRIVVTGSADNTVRLWNAASGQPIGEPLRHDDSVQALAFSPDSRWLATASDDRTVRLWDVENPASVPMPVILRGHEGPVVAVTISPDGAWVASGSADQTVRRWPLQLDELRRQAREAARRNLTRQEWRQFFPEEPYRETFTPSDLWTER